MDWESECFLPIFFPYTKSVVSPSTTMFESVFLISPEFPAFLLVPPNPVSPVSPSVPISRKSVSTFMFPPSLPLLPPLPNSASFSAPAPLFPFSYSAPPLRPLSYGDLPWTFWTPALLWKSPGFISGRRAMDSSSAFQLFSSSLAPCSLNFTGVH